MSELINRADAIEAVESITMSIHLSDVICDKLLALPSSKGGDAEILNEDFRPKYMQQSPSNGADLIRREDAIELCAEAQGRSSTKSELKGISRIWRGLLKLPSAEAVQGWIPCSERLPSEGEVVLASWSCLWKGAIVLARRYEGKWEWAYEHGADYWQPTELKEYWPEAWMPLPKPYREESEVEE